MTFGAFFANDGDIVQIDQDYLNHKVVAFGVATINTDVTLPNNPDCLIFIRPHSYGGYLYYLDNWDISSQFRVAAKDEANEFAFVSGLQFDYIICAPQGSGPQGSGYGMEVYDANGNVVFSSEEKYLNILAVGDVTAAATMELTAGASSRSRYFLLNPCVISGYVTSESASYEYDYWVLAQLASNNSVVYVDMSINPRTPLGGEFDYSYSGSRTCIF